MSGSISVLNTLGRVTFGLAYEISPILLQGGLANQLGVSVGGSGYLPIVALTEPINLVGGLIAGQLPDSLESFWAHFRTVPGGTLIKNEIGEYPFATQTIAGNAVIQQPTNVSLKMTCPVKDAGGYTVKLATFTLLQNYLLQHTQMGGTYIVATPAFIYQNGILLQLIDVTSGDTEQTQAEWQWDFKFPLISLAQAEQAINNQMSKIQSQDPTDGSAFGSNVDSPVFDTTGFAGGL